MLEYCQHKHSIFLRCAFSQVKPSKELNMYLEFFCIIPLYFLHNPDTDIVGFMKDYRRLCPDASVFPKLHYLEDHVVQFIRRWKVGPGTMGEHGGESIHHQFNKLTQRFSSIPHPATRCYHTLKEHLTAVNPSLPAAPQPARKKRKG